MTRGDVVLRALNSDELGIPVILLPRCIGRSLDHGNTVSESLFERLVDQDRRLVESTSTHPSVVLWMTGVSGLWYPYYSTPVAFT